MSKTCITHSQTKAKESIKKAVFQPPKTKLFTLKCIWNTFRGRSNDAANMFDLICDIKEEKNVSFISLQEKKCKHQE